MVVIHTADFETALQMINDHEYGNGTAIFTRDGDVARQFEESVKLRMVGVTVPIPVPMTFHCFGGPKYAWPFFTRMKTITKRLPTGTRSGAEFSMPTMK